MPPSEQQLKGCKNRLLKILHNMQELGELHSGQALDLHNDLAELRSIGIKTDIPNVPPLNLDSIYRQNSRCKVGSKEFKLTIILISETIKNIDMQINNMQFASIRRSGKRVFAPKVPENCTTNSSVPTEESSQVTENTPSEKTDKETWLSRIDEKCPRKDKAREDYKDKKDYYSNANLDILKETIRILRDKVKCAECPVAKCSGVEVKKNDKQILEEIIQDFKKEIKENKKMLKKEEKRIEKFTSSPPKSILRELLELLHLSNSRTR